MRAAIGHDQVKGWSARANLAKTQQSSATLWCGGLLLSALQASDTLAVSVALKATPDMTHKLSKYLVPQQQVGVPNEPKVTVSTLDWWRAEG